MKSLLMLAALLAASPAPTHAADRTLQTKLASDLQKSIPDKWWVRASWRDKTLVVFVSPPPPESFRLWYAGDEQRETLERLCRAVGTDIWNALAPDQDIAMEQVVGGNGGKGSWRLSCRQVVAARGATQ
jgi:hypothetical protein